MLKFDTNDTTVLIAYEDFILTVYIIIVKLYHRYAHQKLQKNNILDDKLTDLEIITISLCGQLASIDCENAWYSFLKKNYKHLFPNLCNRSRFNKTRRALFQTTELLRQKLSSAFMMQCSSSSLQTAASWRLSVSTASETDPSQCAS